MHSLSDRHLLQDLGDLYGSGKLLNGRGGHSEAAVANEIAGRGGCDRLSQAFRSALVRIPVIDAPINDLVLDDPRDDARAEMLVRRRFPDGGGDT
jgi:hypothetical protein